MLTQLKPGCHLLHDHGIYLTVASAIVLVARVIVHQPRVNLNLALTKEPV